MPAIKTNSIKAIELTRRVFEYVHGNLGLLKFNVESLTPTNGSATEESKKWDIVCSFYETLGSSGPSRYKVSVDLNTNTVNFNKISSNPSEPKKDAGSYKVVPTKSEES